MVDVLSEVEGQPSSYPWLPVSSDLSKKAQEQDFDALWRRLESWVVYRWSERTVTWIVAGPGVWSPRLKPATVTAFEVWNTTSLSWESVTLDDAPTGYELDAKTYRFTATVGGVTSGPPSAVMEALRRLAEYLADTSYIGRVAARGTRQFDGSFSVTSERPAAWQAKALHYSGAADLLRPWRT